MRIRKKGFILSLCLITSLAAAGLIVLGSRNINGASDDAEFKLQVRNALAELAFPATNDPVAVRAAAENLSQFISYRSGVLVSDLRIEKLRSAEQLAQDDKKRITRSELADILAGIAVRKLLNLTPDEKDRTVEALRGFYDPHLPDSFRKGRGFVTLRADGTGRMATEKFRSRLDSVSGDNAKSKIVQSMIRNAAALEIDRVCSTLMEADRDFFGGTKCEMTALQALLITYAVVTDDPLAGNRADLSAKMDRIHSGIERNFHTDFPSPEGHAAYGANGYIYSTPADIMLDGDTLDMLIGRIQGKLN